MADRPTDEEIQEEADQAGDNPGKFSGMTYAQGVQAALEWVIGITDVKPMDD